MKTVILRSALIAVVLAPMVALLSVLPLKAIKYVPPIDEREFESMSYREAMAQMQARSRELTTFEWLEEFSRRPFFWAGLARSSVVPFAAIFGGCVWLGYWQRRRPS
jgi:hypothetical protein